MTGRRWQRHRSTLLVVSALLVAVAAVVVWGAGAATTGAPLDPDNPGPDGSQALARVLEDQGVQVRVARGRDGLAEVDPSPGATVLVTSSDELGSSTTQDLLDRTAGRPLVVVDPPLALVAELGVDPPVTRSLTSPLVGACLDTRFDALEAAVDRAQLFAGAGCLRTDDGAALAAPREGLWLLGAGDLLTNEQVVRADNAAVALRLLGTGDELVWYVPDATDLLGEESAGLGGVLPSWLGPATWVVALAVAGLVLWRVRRLGPLVREPLPVSVKAIETTLSRGRLYRRAGDRGHAAAALRGASRHRVALLLRVGDEEGDTLVRQVAHHTGRARDEVGALLDHHAPVPVDDLELVRLAGQLIALEKEVRTS